MANIENFELSDSRKLELLDNYVDSSNAIIFITEHQETLQLGVLGWTFVRVKALGQFHTVELDMVSAREIKIERYLISIMIFRKF